MANQKISALPAATTLTADDLFLLVDNPAGTPASQKITAATLFSGASNPLVFPYLANWVNVKNPIYAGGAVGNGTTNDTAAIAAAIAAVELMGGGVVFFPVGTYLITSSLLVTQNNVMLLGVSEQSSILKFTPASADQVAIVIAAIDPDVTPYVNATIHLVQIHNLSLMDGNATRKVGIRIVDGTEITLHHVKINFTASSANETIGIQIRGQQFIDIGYPTITADIPISIETDPYIHVHCDHTHIHDSFFVASFIRPHIQVLSGVNLLNFVVDGVNGWAQGKYMFYYNDSSTYTPGPTDLPPYNISLKNIRWEQATDAAGWIVYMVGAWGGISYDNIILENIYSGLLTNGFYFRRVNTVTFINTTVIGSGVALDCDSSCTNFHFINPIWAATNTFNTTGFVSHNGYNAATRGRQTFQAITLANNGAALLGPNDLTGGANTAGLVLVVGPGGSVGMFALLGLNNIVQEIADTNAAFSVTAGTAGTNVYWSMGNSRYEIENKVGSSFTYMVYFFMGNQ